MSNPIRETTFRLMIKARVFHKRENGVVTQMFIDESGVGYLPGDNLTSWEKAFVKKNSDALSLAAAMCVLEIARAKTDEDKKKAAHVVFNSDAAADAQPADEAKKLAADVLKQATAEPVIQGLDDKGQLKP